MKKAKLKDIFNISMIYIYISHLYIGFAPIERTRKVNITKVHNDCMELFAYFHNKLIEALVKCTKNSLEILRKKVTEMRSSMLFIIL